MHLSSFLSRFVSVTLVAALTYSGSATGIHAFAGAVADTVQRLGYRRPGPYTERPRPVFKGSNPRRDARTRGGMWSEKMLAEAKKSKRGNGKLHASLGVDPPAHDTVISPEAGGSMPWEGSASPIGPGSLNPANGNKLTPLRLTGWKDRGGMVVDFTLYHNSQSDYNDELGYKWTWSYDIYIEPGFLSATIHFGDGTCIPFEAEPGEPGFPTEYIPPAGIHDVFVKNVNGTYTLTKKDGLRYDFNDDGFCHTITDRNGNAIVISLNSGNFATRVTGPSGRYYDIDLDSGESEFESITDPDGNTWTFHRDGNDDMDEVEWPELDSVTYSDLFVYNGNHCITTHTDKRGKDWDATYNGDCSLATETDPLNHTTTYTYEAPSVTIENPLGGEVVYHYSSGKLASIEDEADFSESYTYDGDNNVLTVTDKRGKVWEYSYDARGNTLTVEDPLSHVWEYTYSADNELLTAEDPLSNLTELDYDADGNLLVVEDPLNRDVVTNTYDTYGQVLTTENGLGHETSIDYDANGYPEAITNPLTKVTDVTFDSMGRVTAAEDPNANAVAVAYDDWGRPVTYTLPDSETKLVVYDTEGNVTSTTNERSKTTTYVYDDAGRLTGTTNAKSESESYGYDNANRRTSVTNGRGKVRTYAYTVRGEVYTLTHADTEVETWSYNGNGQCSAYTNQLAQTIGYGYDDSGRLTGIDYPTGTDTSFGYDNANRITSMVDSTGTTEWTYNAASEITDFDTPQGDIDYTYDGAGRKATMVEVGVGTTTYTYNNGSQLTSLLNPFSETTSWLYDDGGRVTKQTVNSGAYTTYGYDSRSRVTAITHKNSSHSTISSESYVYDATSNLTQKTVNSVVTDYTYDDIDQLLTESRTGYSAVYTYDANGNRATKTLGGVTQTYICDDADKLTSITQGGSTVKSFTYDDAGRTSGITVGGNTTSFAYDYEGRISTITYPSTSTNTFAYNGLDARVSKVDSAGTKTYKRDGIGVTARVLGDGVANYTPGISERRSSATKYVHSDQMGSTERLTDSMQATADTRQFDAFGLLTGSSGATATPFGYAGGYGYQEDSDSGFKLLGCRYYDATTGRFLTRDPSSRGCNWYAYCRNNPLSFVDPDGQEEYALNTHQRNQVLKAIGRINDNGFTNLAQRLERLAKGGDIRIESDLRGTQVWGEHRDGRFVINPDIIPDYAKTSGKNIYRQATIWEAKTWLEGILVHEMYHFENQLLVTGVAHFLEGLVYRFKPDLWEIPAWEAQMSYHIKAQSRRIQGRYGHETAGNRVGSELDKLRGDGG